MRMRALGFGETLDEVFRFYRRNFWLLVLLSLAPVLPTLVFQIASGQAGQYGVLGTLIGSLAGSSTLTGPVPLPAVNLLWLLAGYLVALVLVPFSIGLVPRAALDVALGQPTGFQRTLLGTLRRYGGLFAVAVLLGLVGLLALTCLLIPLSLWILVRWAVAIPVLLNEHTGPVAALARSWHLTRGSWWRTFGILVVAILIEYVATDIVSVIGLPIAALVPFIPEIARGIILVTVSTLGAALVNPIWQLCIVVIYFDLRVRKEHLDLWQLADQANAAALGRA